MLCLPAFILLGALLPDTVVLPTSCLVDWAPLSNSHTCCLCRSPYKTASKELQDLIQAGSEDTERFSKLVDILLDSELPFKESALGNGEWQVQLPCLLMSLR